VREATRLLRERKAEEAEPLLLKARAAEPDAPDILNNLAAAYGLQGRVEQADALTRHLYQRYPDYLFARTNMVQLALRVGEIERAEALVAPLRTRRRFHVSEFAASCSAQLELLLAQNQAEGARSWLEIWVRVDPDHPLLAHWRQRLAHAGRPSLLRRFLRGRRGRAVG